MTATVRSVHRQTRARRVAAVPRAEAPARRSPPLSEQAYESIKALILSLELKPGQFLNELALCERTGMGRMPVHQAVHRLMADGLLDVLPRKGLVIRPDSLNDILALVEARSAVEPNIAALAASRATPEQLEALERLLKASARLVDQRHRKAFMAIDREFHQAVAEAAGNPILVDAQRPLHERSARIWNLIVMRRPDGLALTQAEHQAVFEAIARGNGKAAAAAMQTHLDSLKARITQGWDAV